MIMSFVQHIAQLFLCFFYLLAFVWSYIVTTYIRVLSSICFITCHFKYFCCFLYFCACIVIKMQPAFRVRWCEFNVYSDLSSLIFWSFFSTHIFDLVRSYIHNGGGHLAQCGLDQGSPPSQVPFWSIQPFRHSRHRSKMGRGLRPLFGAVGAGSPSNTMWSGPRPTSVPSGILIHATVWPQ